MDPSANVTRRTSLFGRIALYNKLITQEQLNRAIAEISANPGMKLGAALVSLGHLTERQVEKILGLQRKMMAQQGFATQDIPVPRPEAEPVSTPAAAPAPAPAAPVPGDVFDFTRIEQYLSFAREASGSDLHISVGSPPSVRVNGELQFLEHESFTGDDTEETFRSFLTDAQFRELIEQKSIEFCLTLKDGSRYRVCIFKQRNGYDGAFRLIATGVPAIQQLGLPESVLRLTEYHQGIVLITGPAGHGKSTTLISLVEHLNQTRSEHIITIEDPIEQVLVQKKSMVSQREVNTHTDSFAAALRAALREDPDIIVIGELRDLETISLAITAAETGHLVLATTHTTSALRTINRILDVFPPDQQPQVRAMISESLKGVITQYLVPRADGRGRALAYEILFNTNAIANLIRDDRVFQIHSQMQAGKKQGMVLMDETLRDLVRRNIVAKDVAASFAEAPKSFLTGGDSAC